MSWESKNLEDVFEIARGGSPRPIKDYLTEEKDGVNWIKIGDTKEVSKYIHSTKEKIKPSGIKKSQLVEVDDFILSNSMSFGRPYIMKTKGCIHDGWLLLRAKSSDTSVDYMYYLLSSELIANQFKRSAAGSTVQNLNIKLVKKVKAPIPPFSEQQKIAEILSTVDAKIENIEQQIRETEQLKKGMMQRLLTQGIGHTEFKDSPLGRIPKSWEVVALGERGDFSKGKGASKKELVEVGLPCIRYGELYTTYNEIIRDIISFIPEDIENLPTEIGYGDILFAGSGETLEEIGKSAVYLQGDIAYAGGDIIIYNSGAFNPIFLAYYLNCPISRQQMRKMGQGNSVVHIYSKQLGKLQVLTPPEQEQEEIGKLFLRIDDKILSLEKREQSLLELKKGLMQNLLTGKIRVRTNNV